MIKDRMKELRKELRLTQQAFADRLCVKRNTIAKYETGINAPVDSVVALICREFNVSEDWLRHGTGEMFIEADVFSLDDFAKAHGMTALEQDIIKTYFELDESIRKNVLGHFKAHFTQQDESPKLAFGLSDDEIEAELASYRAELEAERKGAEKSAATPDTKNA